MNYQITSDNIDLSPSMIELAKKKLFRLEHKVADIPKDQKSLRIVLNSAPQNTFETKIEMTIDGKKYFANEMGYSLEESLIIAIEEIDRQMQKTKGIIEKEWQKQRNLKRLPRM